MAMAQTDGKQEGADSSWGLGVSGVAIKKAYRGIDQDNLALPLITYESKWISAAAPRLDFKVFTGEAVSIRLRARYALDGYEAKDSEFLSGMDKRKGSAWLGGAIIWKTGVADLTAEVLGDAMGNSKGTRARVGVDRRFSSGAFGITPRLAVEWVDSKYVDYYYGVKASEARAGRSFYEGKSTTNFDAGIRLDYSPARHHTVFLDVQSTRFGSGIKESPVVGKSYQNGVSLGYLYRF